MSKQRIVKDEMWDDEWFYDLDPTEKLVWVFLLTNPRNNIAGIYQLNRRWAANTVGLDRDVFDVILRRFEAERKIKTHEEWVVLLNFHKHQSQNPKVTAGVVRIVNSLPREIGYILPMDSLCIAYPTLLNSTLLNLSVGEQSSQPLQDNQKDMGWNKYSDDHEEGVVDLETGELTNPEEDKKVIDVHTRKRMNELTDWLIDYQGRDKLRTNRPKQFKALGELMKMKVTGAEAQQIIMEQMQTDFWKSKKEKPDFCTVVSIIQKRGE